MKWLPVINKKTMEPQQRRTVNPFPCHTSRSIIKGVRLRGLQSERNCVSAGLSFPLWLRFYRLLIRLLGWLLPSEGSPFLYSVNLLTSTGHVMHQQFNIQQLYVLSGLYLGVLYRVCGSLSPRHGASSGCRWRNGLRYGG